MTIKVGMRELARNMSMLDKYDYIEVEDKKSHEYKGLFISAKYAKEFKKLLEEKITQEKQREIDEVLQFAGMLDGETKNMSIQEIKASKREKYYDK